MKKISLLLLSVILISLCRAQSKFDIFAGGQATTAKYLVEGVKQQTDNKYGFQAGFGWKIDLEDPVFFAPAAFYSLKGYKVTLSKPDYPPDTLATDNNTTIHTFELAFLLQFDLGKKESHPFIKVGPTLDFQLVGNEEFHVKNGTLVDRSMPFSYTSYGHFSANVLLQFGFETKKGLIIAGQYTYGLASINNADDGPHIYHRGYGITIGKYLKNKK